MPVFRATSGSTGGLRLAGLPLGAWMFMSPGMSLDGTTISSAAEVEFGRPFTQVKGGHIGGHNQVPWWVVLVVRPRPKKAIVESTGGRDGF